MDLQHCPKCKVEAFSRMNEENPCTSWRCSACQYSAEEDKAFISTCRNCEGKPMHRLTDEHQIYWWCPHCNINTLLTNIPSYRYSTGEAIDFLAKELNYRREPDMQDWEYEVSDVDDVEKYLHIYQSTQNEDIRFTLMLMIIDTSGDDDWMKNIWPQVVSLLRQNFRLHEYTIYYWCCFGNENIEDAFDIAPAMRAFWKAQTGWGY